MSRPHAEADVFSLSGCLGCLLAPDRCPVDLLGGLIPQEYWTVLTELAVPKTRTAVRFPIKARQMGSQGAGTLVSRSQTVTLAVTVWTTAVKRFVLSSPGSRVGDKWLLSASGTAKGMNLITYSLCYNGCKK